MERCWGKGSGHQERWWATEVLQGGAQGEGRTERESGEVLGEREWPPGEMVGHNQGTFTDVSLWYQRDFKP